MMVQIPCKKPITSILDGAYKKKDIPLGMSFFLGSAAFGRLHPIYFICSGGINPPGIKIFAMQNA